MSIYIYVYRQSNIMIFQSHKVIILTLVIFCLTNIVHSFQCENQIQNKTQNYIQIELDKQIEQVKQFEPIKSHSELFQYNTLSLIVCLFYINQQI